jgi:hypothetical protein
VKNLTKKSLQKLILQEAKRLHQEKRSLNETVAIDSSRRSRKNLRTLILKEAKKMGIVDAPKENWPRPGDKTSDVANKAEFSKMKVDKEAAKLVSHSCANHVLMESEVDQDAHGISESTALGKCVWHSLNESGHVSHYDVQFGEKLIKNIPANKLIVVSESNHMHETRPKKKSKKK